ncbi:hypothetical protein QBC35DRAFT_394829 [Podospora australis]|uniref:VOC domain-containing protein n=1 Tax=Podospora australis TaxID=1536484 RepID=A0AAN6WJI6_9PEZI|nr:hypothetical protein QBC35DRAFT_394829 [Podospora australis]
MSCPTVANPPSFFLNLPTGSITNATAFFLALSFSHIKEWSDDKTVAFRLPGCNSNICLMVNDHSRMQEFMRPGSTIADANTTTEALFSFMAVDKNEVEDWVKKAVAAGGKADPYTLPGYGGEMGMYNRSFADLDGHIWEACSMVSGGCSFSGVNDAPA